MPDTTTTAPPAMLTKALIRAHYLPPAERTLDRLISAGRFPRADIAIGGKIRLWKRESVEAWMQSQGGHDE